MSIQKYFRGKLLDSSEKKRRCLGFRFPMDAGHRTVLPLSVKIDWDCPEKPDDSQTVAQRSFGRLASQVCSEDCERPTVCVLYDEPPALRRGQENIKTSPRARRQG